MLISLKNGAINVNPGETESSGIGLGVLLLLDPWYTNWTAWRTPISGRPGSHRVHGSKKVSSSLHI